MTTTTFKQQVILIPWDPASPDHVSRLTQQRKTCGWDYEGVESWRATQETGEFNLQWIVLSEDYPNHEATVLKHTSTYPQESSPLLDSAVSFGGKPRPIPSPQRSFIPIGHISLGPVSKYLKDLGYVQDEPGLFWIGIFYISRALQGSGLGRAALDTVEYIAISEPLNAKVLAMNAISKDDPEKVEKYEALGLTIPPASEMFSNEEWYRRRGYKQFNKVEKQFKQVDSTGKTWSWDAVYLKKYI